MQKTLKAFLVIAVLWCTQVSAQNPARPVVEKMLTSMDRILSFSGRIKRTERINGKLEEGELRFKVMYQPTFKAYVYNIKPDEGAEVLYVKGWNSDNAYVHPNRFPWVNVSLDPEGSTMAGNQHHSLFSLGPDYFRKIIRHYLDKYNDEFDDHVIYQGTQKWNNKTCHVVKIAYKEYTTFN